MESIKAEVLDLNVNVLYLDDGTFLATQLIWLLNWRSLNVLVLQAVYFWTDPTHFSIFQGQAPLAPTRYQLTFQLLEMVLFFFCSSYVKSVVETFPLVSKITSTDSPTSNLVAAISSLAEATLHPDSIESDDSIHQHSLSKCIDEVSDNQLLTSAPTTVLEPWYITQLCLMLATGSLLCHPPHLGYIYSTESSPMPSVLARDSYLGRERVMPPSVIAQKILWVTIRLAVAVTTIELLVTILFVTLFCRLLKLQL